MVDLKVFNNNNVSDEEIIHCASQIETSDYPMCKICANHSACVGISIKRIVTKMQQLEEENKNDKK